MRFPPRKYISFHYLPVRVLSFLILLFVGIVSYGQIPNNSWRDHLSFNQATVVAMTPQKVYSSMINGGMLVYHRSSGEYEKWSKVNGLSDINVTALAYSSEAAVLIIGYQNGNIDLLTSSGLINMPDIKRKRMSAERSILMIHIYGTKAYLACSFGVVEIDLIKKEVVDTYMFGPDGSTIEVNDITVLDNFLYAATKIGIYRADLNAPNLVDFSFWQRLMNIPQPNSDYKRIETFDNQIFALFKSSTENTDKIIRFTHDENWNYWVPVTDTLINQLRAYNNKLAVVTNLNAHFFNSSLQQIQEVYMPRGQDAVYDADGNIYAAATFKGFLVFIGGTQEQWRIINGPLENITGYVHAKDDHIWVGSGGFFKVYANGAAYHFFNEKWFTLSPNNSAELAGIGNFNRFAFHPNNINHVYASAYRYALFEFKDEKVVARHDFSNTPLFAEKIPNELGVRIMNMAFDFKGDLWTVMESTPQPVFILRGGKDWYQPNLKSTIFQSASKWRDLIITKTNQVWLLDDRNGVVVLQELSDGSIREKYFPIKNQDGELLSAAYCLAEDLDGNVWIGTSKGPIFYNSSNQIFNETEVIGNQIKIPRNDGTGLADYLLDYEIINDISVDGGNQKWLATENSGVFLVSPDGKKTIHHFTSENSPLISDNVISVDVQQKTGEVFISTNKGMIAFMGRSTVGNEDYSDVYVYPNPVRPDYEGEITVSGLVENSVVKITDISGNLVFETTSLGGKAVWNGKNFYGERVNTGIYLVFLATEDGSKTHITKLVFIH